jgi:hypothetical protein
VQTSASGRLSELNAKRRVSAGSIWEVTVKSLFVKSVAALGVTTAVSAAGVTASSAADLTLCWAAWDPANALVELSKDFEAKQSAIR